MAPTRANGARVQATVTGVSPLMVLVDGAQTACPATKDTDLTLTVGVRVRCEDRAPRRPMVTETIELEEQA